MPVSDASTARSHRSPMTCPFLVPADRNHPTGSRSAPHLPFALLWITRPADDDVWTAP